MCQCSELVFQLTHQHEVDMVFVLLKQSFATDLACFGRFVLINLAWQSNGRFSDTYVNAKQ